MHRHHGEAALDTSREVQIGAKALVARLWPSTAAALVMAGAITALEQLVIDAASHPTAIALLLLTAEGLLAFGVYVGVLVALAPDTPGELRAMREIVRKRNQA